MTKLGRIQLFVDREADGRFFAEAPDLPGVLAYGRSPSDARARAMHITRRFLQDADHRLDIERPLRDLPHRG